MQKLSILLLCSVIWIGCDSSSETTHTAGTGKPRNLTLTQTGINSFRVDWLRAANDTEADTIRIKRGDLPTIWVESIPPPVATMTYTDSTLPYYGGTYSVCVASKDSITDWAQITIPLPPKGKPRNIVLKKTADNAFSISWERAENDVTADTVKIFKNGKHVSNDWFFFPLSSAEFTDPELLFNGGLYTVLVSSRDSISDQAEIELPKFMPTEIGVPERLEVTSIDSSSIAARWFRAFGDIYPNLLIATPVGKDTPVAQVLVDKTASTATVTGLNQNVRYNLQAVSTGGRSAPIEWATAARSKRITLYETDADKIGAGAYPSSLILGPQSRAVSLFGPERSNIDLVLISDITSYGSQLSIEAPHLIYWDTIEQSRATHFGDEYYLVTGGLDEDFYTESFADKFSQEVNHFPIPGELGPSAIMLVKTADIPARYARIEILSHSGSLWRQYGDYRVVDLIVSYQTLSGAAYAGRPAGEVRKSNTQRKSGSRQVVKR